MRYIKRTVDLNAMGKVDMLPGSLFEGENLAHTFQISARRGDEAVALSGEISAVFDNETRGVSIPLEGCIADGAAQVTLGEGCYMQGRFSLTVYLSAGDAVTALYHACGVIDQAGGGVPYDPQGLIPDLARLTREFTAAVASIPADYNAVLETFAPLYSALAFPVSAGQTCWREGALYKAKADIAECEPWTAAHWEAQPISAAAAHARHEIANLNVQYRLFQRELPNTTQEILLDGEGSVASITHKQGAAAIRTDTFSFGGDTITEIRTLSTGEALTIVTDLVTLETAASYTE